ncbi:unnamed protein product, partial [Scytosiphon promiscuus]
MHTPAPPQARLQRQQARIQWQSALDVCRAVWAQLRGVPLLPLANGTAGTFPKTYFLGGRQSFVLATRRQQGLLPQLKGRFVHLNATRRLAKFFERDEFLEMMGIVRFTPALLADNLDQVLPRGWRGAKFIGWEGGSAAGAAGGPGATWLARFWSEVSLLDVASVPGLAQWPLIPITTGELVSCSMLQQIVRACPSMLNKVKMRGLNVALATAARADKAADERDEKELQDMLARQAQESNPTGQTEEDDDEDEDDDDDDVEGFVDGRDTAGSGDGPGDDGTEPGPEAVTSSGGLEGAADRGAEDELQSVGDASPSGDSVSSSGTYASATGTPEAVGAAGAASATGGSAFSSPTRQGRPGVESPPIDVGTAPPRPPGSSAAAPPPPPPPSAAATGASAPQGLSMGVGSALTAVAAAAVAAGQRVATTASEQATAAASAAIAARA